MTLVISIKDGTLFCFDCGEFIPNTANFEMQKEGSYSYSHTCPKNNKVRQRLKEKLYEELKQ